MHPQAKELTKDILLPHLAKMWGTGTFTNYYLLSGGTESAAWFVQEKNNGNKWIVKVFGLEDDLNKIKDEVKLYQFLNDHNIHTPVLKKDINKQHLNFINFKNCRFPVIIMRFENLKASTPSTITKSELTKIAGETAKMHKVLLEYPNIETLGNIKQPEEDSEDIDEPRSAYEALEHSVHKNKFSKAQLERFAEVDLKMEKYIKKYTPLLPLTESVIHADLSLEHAQFLADGNVYFFDFADRYWGPVAQDLATFMTTLYQWEDISFARWEELKRWLLDGYQTVTELTSNDLNAISQNALIRLLGANKYLAVLTKNTPSEHVVNWIRRAYALGNYITNKQ